MHRARSLARSLLALTTSTHCKRRFRYIRTVYTDYYTSYYSLAQANAASARS